MVMTVNPFAFAASSGGGSMTGAWADISTTGRYTATASNAAVTPGSVGTPSVLSVVMTGSPPSADATGYMRIIKNGVSQGNAYSWNNGTGLLDNESLTVNVSSGDTIYFTARLYTGLDIGGLAASVAVYDSGVLVDTFTVNLETTG